MAGFLVVLALYVPYFFLPVMDYRGPILGLEGFLYCVVVPMGWPIVLGHLALWFGAICLLLRRWRAAWIAGALALVVSIQSWQLMLGGYRGQYMKLVSMIALLGTGLVGATYLGPASEARKPKVQDGGTEPGTTADRRRDERFF
jgi:hypothetical protein